MPEPVDRKDPVEPERRKTGGASGKQQASGGGRQERDERDMRDREELGRPPAEARERALAEDVTARRDREAREEADRIENGGGAQ